MPIFVNTNKRGHTKIANHCKGGVHFGCYTLTCHTQFVISDKLLVTKIRF